MGGQCVCECGRSVWTVCVDGVCVCVCVCACAWRVCVRVCVCMCHLGDQQQSKQEADGADEEEEQLSSVAPPEHVWEHVCDRSHQALQAHKLTHT